MCRVFHVVPVLGGEEYIFALSHLEQQRKMCSIDGGYPQNVGKGTYPLVGFHDGNIRPVGSTILSYFHTRQSAPESVRGVRKDDINYAFRSGLPCSPGFTAVLGPCQHFIDAANPQHVSVAGNANGPKGKRNRMPCG